MRGIYTASIEIASLSAAKTVLLIECASTKIIEILSISLTNENQTTAEQLQIALLRVTTKGSPAGTTANSAVSEIGTAATGATVLGDLSAEPTTYAAPPLYQEGVNNLAGFHYDPLPEERPTIAPSGLVGLKLLANPTNAFKCVATITYREMG